MKALLVYPTHQNCRETAQGLLDYAINAVCFPARTTRANESQPPNCWNEQADRAEGVGFSVMKAICPTCRQRPKCLERGYLGQIQRVKVADVALCTHKRAEYSGLRELGQGCRYVSVHENPINLVRPRLEVTEADLRQVQFVLTQLLNDPHFLDWFGDFRIVDDEGEVYESDELRLRKERIEEFCRLLAVVVDQFLDLITRSERTTTWTPPEPHRAPSGLERLLFEATKVSGARFRGQPWRFVLAAATGKLTFAAVIVTQFQRKGSDGHPPPVRKSLIGFRNNEPPPTATCWFNDATLPAERLAKVLHEQIQNKTPVGHLALQKKAIQIPRDITRQTTPAIVAAIVRGVLIDRPQFQRVGIIGHSNHREVWRTLESEFARRIVRTSYFGSGEERSSNAWHHECDLILVMGTPRIPPAEIVSYLLQVGEGEAALRDPPWETFTWEGVTESQQAVRIMSRGYLDDAWRQAHRDLVRGTIVQAIGRGRGILESGCEVIVLSNEECGLPISDSKLAILGDSEVQVLAALRELSLGIPNKSSLGKTSVSTAQVAELAHLSVQRTRAILMLLEHRGLIQRIGERGGWLPISPVVESPEFDQHLVRSVP